MSALILTLNQVTKKFGDKVAVNDMNLELNEGVYGILGANGSGKTTLMRMLATVMHPTSGQLLLDGKDIFQLDDAYRDLVGYLPQQVGLYKNFTAEKFLLYIAALKGLGKEQAKQKVDQMLRWVGLEAHRREKVGKFSGGMKQRVGIAQALLNDPKILIVDEPTAGLDPKERIRFRNLMSSIAANRIVVLSTHIVSDLEYIAREIVIMKDGRLIKKDNPQKLLARLDGKVWLVTISDAQLAFYQEQYKVGNIIRRENGIEIRVISDEKPQRAAIVAAPNLEDLYLYYFD
ncbi:ABC transporter ATP-binding protein [Sporolactobacillus sp. THM19-2]|uniref:ABC transporter ATP-binding protein n=1 Tax=Sporolactobacillus sp. THM19-2 TaxID=2511171 RepID=UPI002DBA7D4E|nr:ABC transporter ATP-binding protein [Sporolactobacillus sp. THM19-2]